MTKYFKLLSPFRYIVLTISIVLITSSCQTWVKSIKQNQSDIPVISNSDYEILISDLEKSIPQLMTDVKIPGLSIVLVNDSGIIWHGNFGFKDVMTMLPVDDQTVFQAASLSKVVFAYNVLKMADAGKLHLDTPLIKYAPGSYIEKEFLKIKDERFNQITARMVLTHSSGIPDMNLFGTSVKINFTPGEQFSYSGEGFFLLQKIVEYIEGEPINEIMKKNVFIPLGMRNSSYVYEERFKDRLALGHNNKGEPGLFNLLLLSKGKKAHVGRSLSTTSEDYARFLNALMNGKGLKSETYYEMLSFQINAGAINSDNIFWGLGIGIESRNSENCRDTCYWHLKCSNYWVRKLFFRISR